MENVETITQINVTVGGNHIAACGDFNAHNTMWRDQEDLNEKVIEEILDDKSPICLNIGVGTRMNLRAQGTESSRDLVLVPQILVGKVIALHLNTSELGSVEKEDSG